MNQSYEHMVQDFMLKHGQYQTLTPHHPPPKVRLLRLRLMAEELGELAAAMHEEDLVETADALADLLYVVFGTALAYGLPIREIFAEVHRSNMSKGRLNHHGKGGKVGKGVGFTPPALEPLLRAAGAGPLPR